MGIELELAVLLALQTLGTSLFAVFEAETPIWRKVVKWLLIVGATLGSFPLVHHWCLLLPISIALLGLIDHILFCRQHGIHPIKATPRKKYYKLRGWTWPE